MPVFDCKDQKPDYLFSTISKFGCAGLPLIFNVKCGSWSKASNDQPIHSDEILISDLEER